MRYFVAVAEELHFGRAAARLHVVQPAVSQQIRLLEEDLGAPLLDRANNRTTLTEAGKVFLVEARKVLQQAAIARQSTLDAVNGLIGDLTIGFVDNAIWGILPGVAREFRAKYPGVNLDLKQMSRTAQVDALQGGDIDIGILPGPVQSSDLHCITLLEAPIHVCLPRLHSLAAVDSVQIADLALEPFVAFPSSSDVRRIDEIILGQCAQAGFLPRFAQPVQQMHTALALVSAGFGIAFVPPWMMRAWTDDVVYRPLRPYTPYILMLARRADRRRPIAQAFEQIALAHGAAEQVSPG